MSPSRRSRLLPSLLAGCLLSQAAAACQPDAEMALAALNRLRQEARRCGSQDFAAAGPLRWSPLLLDSAQHYAKDLAQRDRIDHVGEAARSLRLRLADAGYAMKSAGENLAGGPETLDEVITTWLASPGHCENLMWPSFSEAGLSCVTGPGQLQRYWVLHLAEPTLVRSSRGRSP
jgi:uncharacterized protein YkwD